MLRSISKFRAHSPRLLLYTSKRCKSKDPSKRTILVHDVSSRQSIIDSINVYTGYLDRRSDRCKEMCILPRVIHKKVTICGAGTDVGRIVALFLKQPNTIETLALFDWVKDNKVHRLAEDISQIDTATKVESYEGWQSIRKAFLDTELLVLVNGIGRCVNQTPLLACAQEAALFEASCASTRAAAVAAARFCPRALVAVAVPPVTASFSMVAHVFQEVGVFDCCRMLGVSSLAAMRANTMAGGVNPHTTKVPVVGGASGDACVPVFSADKGCCIQPWEQMEKVAKLVRNADRIICNMKLNEGHARLSSGFATARCAKAIMTGLFEKPTILDSGLMWQPDPAKSYGLQVCSCPLLIGSTGIETCYIPRLDKDEASLLEQSKKCLAEQILLGKCMALGEDFYTAQGF